LQRPLSDTRSRSCRSFKIKHPTERILHHGAVGRDLSGFLGKLQTFFRILQRQMPSQIVQREQVLAIHTEDGLVRRDGFRQIAPVFVNPGQRQSGHVRRGCLKRGLKALPRHFGMVFPTIDFREGHVRLKVPGVSGFRGRPRFAGLCRVAGSEVPLTQQILQRRRIGLSGDKLGESTALPGSFWAKYASAITGPAEASWLLSRSTSRRPCGPRRSRARLISGARPVSTNSGSLTRGRS